MSKGVFFFQLPNSKTMRGYEGEWHAIDRFENCQNGFVFTTFNKEKVFSMSTFNQVDLSLLEDLVLPSGANLHKIGKSEYEELVQSAIEFCKVEKGKVVISRIKRHQLDSGVDLRKLFKSLCDTYAHAFNYLCHIPGVGTWMGASPEKLLVGDAPNFEIASLAGSRSVDNQFEWSQKEIQEQSLVTESIEETLKGLSIEYTKTETETIRSGNVEHLFTGFETKNCIAPLLLAEQLHPTPAVSGMPKNKAIKFINANEVHQREFYAGVVGAISNDRYDLYVNLRCAKFYNDNIDLYVGGGITKDSVPSDEWDETEFKSQTLLSIIEKM